MVKQGEQKRVQDRVVVTERDQAGSLGKLADAVRGQNTGELVQKPEQPAEEQTEVTEQLLFAGQGMHCRYGLGVQDMHRQAAAKCFGQNAAAVWMQETAWTVHRIGRI